MSCRGGARLRCRRSPTATCAPGCLSWQPAPPSRTDGITSARAGRPRARRAPPLSSALTGCWPQCWTSRSRTAASRITRRAASTTFPQAPQGAPVPQPRGDRATRDGIRRVLHPRVPRLIHRAALGELTALRVRDVDALRRRLAVNENAVRVGAEIHVGSPKTHELRSVPYPEFLELPIAKMCEGKARDGLLFGDGVDYLGRPRSSGASRSWFMTGTSTRRALNG